MSDRLKIDKIHTMALRSQRDGGARESDFGEHVNPFTTGSNSPGVLGPNV